MYIGICGAIIHFVIPGTYYKHSLGFVYTFMWALLKIVFPWCSNKQHNSERYFED